MTQISNFSLDRQRKLRFRLALALITAALLVAMIGCSDSHSGSTTQTKQQSWIEEADPYGAFTYAGKAALDDVNWPKGVRAEAAIACVNDGRVKLLGPVTKQEYSVESWLEDSSGRVWYLVYVRQIADGEWKIMRDENGMLMAYWILTPYGEVHVRFKDRY